MVEIKEEDLYVTDRHGYDQVEKFHVETEEFTQKEAEQLKQQILQDHEFRKCMNIADIERCKEHWDEFKKDRQIVKRLEERLEELIEDAYTDNNCQKVNYMDSGYYCDCECCCLFEEYQKILEEKK